MSHLFFWAATSAWPATNAYAPSVPRRMRPSVSLRDHFGPAVAKDAPLERPAAVAALAMASASVVLPEPTAPVMTRCLPEARAAAALA